jgi:hypothetical protein
MPAMHALFALMLLLAGVSDRSAHTATAALVLGGFKDDTFHYSVAHAVSLVLTSAGVENTLVGYGHAELFDELFNGTVDVLVDAWLPTGHAGYLAGHTIGEDYVVAGTL